LGPTSCSGFNCSPTPVAVTELSNVKAIAAGGNHALALLNNGTVMAWGGNSDGQLGDETSSGPSTCSGGVPCSPTPVAVTTPNGAPIGKVEAIAAGDAFSLALLPYTAGVSQVQAWGNNDFGQLGQGSISGPSKCGIDSCSTAPVRVSGLSGTEVGIAANGAAQQALALEQNGSVAAWGDNTFGEAGSACGTPFCPGPKLVPGIGNATAIAGSGGPQHGPQPGARVKRPGRRVGRLAARRR
jgi:alpha-tubulin suppressor-like RCC1 family protein